MGNEADTEQFTGLILLSGVDKPGITQALFEVLSPFAITIVDIEQVVIKDRLILTVLVSLNAAHQEAISKDLEECALALDVDIATLFSFAASSSITSKKGLVHIVILSKKINPSAIAEMANGISLTGANIERITRLASSPITAIEFVVSGSNQPSLGAVLSPIAAKNLSLIHISEPTRPY